MRIAELLDIGQLSLDIENGYVNERVHPNNPDLRILNYADKCQYEPYWTDVTRKTRGLIWDAISYEVVARPFEKFFNYGQEDLVLDPDAMVMGAFDKLDGSLGIGYWDGTKYAIATRGSFESEQAIHATEWLNREENAEICVTVVVKIANNHTPLFEIIYPENRIVVDYGNRDELVYLGSVDNETGEFHPNEKIAISPKYPTLRDLLDMPDRPNAEGMVVWVNPTYALKLKQDDYVALHKIVTGLSQKEIWRQLRARTYDEFVVHIPDEFHKWADATAKDLWVEYWDIFAAAHSYFDEVRFHQYETRKEQAGHIFSYVPQDYMALVFMLLDSKPIDDIIWKKIEPVGANPMKVIVE